MRLKLHRRMLVKSMRSRHGKITIAGQVVQPLTAPVKTVVVKRRVSCRDWKVVKRFKPRSDGTFTVKLPAPRTATPPSYRMTTRVKLYAYLTKTYPTFTLPRYVDLGVEWGQPHRRAGENRVGCARPTRTTLTPWPRQPQPPPLRREPADSAAADRRRRAVPAAGLRACRSSRSRSGSPASRCRSRSGC